MAKLTKRELEYIQKTTRPFSIERFFLAQCLMSDAERRAELKKAKANNTKEV